MELNLIDLMTSCQGGFIGITVLCYVLAEFLKKTPLDNGWIPSICPVAGGLFGILVYFCGMEGFPASDPMTAFFIGLVSGAAATGGYEWYKKTFCRAQAPAANYCDDGEALG